MKQRKAERFVTEAEERARLQAQARVAVERWRATGVMLGCYNNRRVLGSAIGLGLASHDELKAAGLNVPLVLKGRAE